ncbi:MAG: signal peptidase II [Dokdonella sp.]
MASLNPSRPSPNALLWLLLSLDVIIFDQVSKWFALAHLQPYQPVAAIDGVLNWMLAFNPGAAFSFLADSGGWQRWFFTTLAIVVSAVLVVWLSRTARRDWRNAAPLALIIGGAMGNVIDRARLGHVVDFIDVYVGEHHWPAFNIADSAICVGAVSMIAFSVFAKPAER